MDGGGLEGRGNELVGKEGQVKTGRSEGGSLGDIRSEVWKVRRSLKKEEQMCTSMFSSMCSCSMTPPCAVVA